jgi:WD40 repeat protein
VPPAAARHSQNTSLSYLYSSEWPPAISPSHIKFFARGYSCLLDNFGKLITADLRKPGHYKALGELTDIGKRVFDFAVLDEHGYALVMKETESDDLQHAVSIIDLTELDSPSLLQQQSLSEFNSFHSIVASEGFLCIAGISSTAQHLVAAYKVIPPNKKVGTPSLKLVKSFPVASPVQKITLEHSRLYVLASDSKKSVVYRTQLASSSQVLEQVITLDDELTAMAVNNNLILAIGETSNGLGTILINLSPAPHSVCRQTLGNAQAVYDLLPRKSDFLLLLERDQDLNLLSMSWDKSLSLTPSEDVTVTKFAGGPDTRARIDVSYRYANVVTAGDSVYVLTEHSGNWEKQSTFTTPSLPISSLCFWGNYLVTAGPGLSLYDTAQPRRTHKVLAAKTEGTVNAIAIAGSYLLCQTKDSLSLRKVDQLDEVIASIKVSGQRLIYDDTSGLVYVVARQDNKTTITPVHVYSNKFIGIKPFSLPAAYVSIASFGSMFVLGGGQDLGLYKLGNSADLVGNHHFPNYVIRAVSSTSDYLLATAVDHDLKGHLLVISPEPSGDQLELVGSTELPQDACALAAAGNRVLVIGQSPKGKSLLTAVRLDDPSQPQIEKTTEVLSGTCALAIQEGLAAVAGRGLQILNA